MEEAVAVLEFSGFADPDGYPAKADWYAVGGRWSGLLTEITPAAVRARKQIERMLRREYPALASGIRGVRYGSPEQEGLRAIAVGRANDLYLDATGVPYERDTDRVAFYDDDAARITAAMLSTVRERYGDVEVCLTRGGAVVSEQKLARLADAEIVGAWLVVIDYHC